MQIFRPEKPAHFTFTFSNQTTKTYFCDRIGRQDGVYFIEIEGDIFATVEADKVISILKLPQA